jgi:hypothetical protein
MKHFDKILNWELKRGSHAFPGPSGGTCINEAALVAAGYKYRPISSPEEMPKETFSQTICTYALALNDTFCDATRQKLLRYVALLAGTASGPETESDRFYFISTKLDEMIVKYAASDHLNQECWRFVINRKITALYSTGKINDASDELLKILDDAIAMGPNSVLSDETAETRLKDVLKNAVDQPSTEYVYNEMKYIALDHMSTILSFEQVWKSKLLVTTSV